MFQTNIQNQLSSAEAISLIGVTSKSTLCPSRRSPHSSATFAVKPRSDSTTDRWSTIEAITWSTKTFKRRNCQGTSEESTESMIFSSVPMPSTAPYHLKAGENHKVIQMIQHWYYLTSPPWYWPSKLWVKIWPQQPLQKWLRKVLWHLEDSSGILNVGGKNQIKSHSTTDILCKFIVGVVPKIYFRLKKKKKGFCSKNL